MNLLTNGSVNNCGRLFGRTKQFEAEMDVRVDTLAADFGG
jgi:hypothetical protein